MRRLAVVSLLLAAGCALHQREDPAEVMINLSVTPQVCAREDGTVEVHAFVSRY